jgi:flagellar M-ring protein FliF
MESRIESTLVEILEPLVGRGRVRARATVELNGARVQRVEETYDPDGTVVRSEVKSRTRTTGAGQGGVPGTASNLPGGTPVAAAGAGGQADSQSSTTNFEINKTVATIAEPVGRLVRQSVAVVVDHAVRTDVSDSGEETRQPVPRTEEEMRKITDLVRAAVGIDHERGDVLIVENVPFEESGDPAVDATDPGVDWVHVGLQIARYGALPLAVLLVAMLVIRPGIAALRSLRQPAGSAGVPLTVAELQARIGEGGAAVGGSDLRRKLIEAASEDPAAAALVVRGWMGSREGD